MYIRIMNNYNRCVSKTMSESEFSYHILTYFMLSGTQSHQLSKPTKSYNFKHYALT